MFTGRSMGSDEDEGLDLLLGSIIRTLCCPRNELLNVHV